MATQEEFLEVFPDGRFKLTLERLCRENGWSLTELLSDEHGDFEEPEDPKAFLRSVAWLRSSDGRPFRVSLERSSLQVAVLSSLGFDAIDEVNPLVFMRMMRMMRLNCVLNLSKWCVWHRNNRFWFAQIEEAQIADIGERFIPGCVTLLTDSSRAMEQGGKTPQDALVPYLDAVAKPPSRPPSPHDESRVPAGFPQNQRLPNGAWQNIASVPPPLGGHVAASERSPDRLKPTHQPQWREQEEHGFASGSDGLRQTNEIHPRRTEAVNDIMIRDFKFSRDFRNIHWKGTLLHNLLRCFCTGIVFCLLMVFTGYAKNLQADPPPFVLPLLMPLMWLLFLPLGIVAAWLGQFIPFVGMLTWPAAMMIIPGDPLVWLISLFAPRLVPMERPGFIHFTQIIWLIRPETTTEVTIHRI